MLRCRGQRGRWVMFAHESRTLLILPQDVLDRARVMAGQATTRLKLPVSVQIVLRALIDEGLHRPSDRTLLANVARQAWAIHRLRSRARQTAAQRTFLTGV
jgi:hypothetical protein